MQDPRRTKIVLEEENKTKGFTFNQSCKSQDSKVLA